MHYCPLAANTLLTVRALPHVLPLTCGQGWQYGTVQFEITVRYDICWAKSMVRNYGTIYFPRYGTVRKYDIFVVLFSNLFRTNLIIERRPLRYVRNQDLYRFRHVSMTYSKLYRVLYIVQKTHIQDFGLYMGLLIDGLDF